MRKRVMPVSAQNVRGILSASMHLYMYMYWFVTPCINVGTEEPGAIYTACCSGSSRYNMHPGIQVDLR